MVKLLEWKTIEYTHTEKGSDWYWAVGIIAATAAIVAAILGNAIFSILIIVSAVALCVHAAKPPAQIRCEVTSKGVIVHDTLFPYSTLESFAVETMFETPKLILKSRKFFMPYVVLIIEEVDPEKVREIIGAFLKEEEHHEPFGHKLMEYFGF